MKKTPKINKKTLFSSVGALLCLIAAIVDFYEYSDNYFFSLIWMFNAILLTFYAFCSFYEND